MSPISVACALITEGFALLKLWRVKCLQSTSHLHFFFHIPNKTVFHETKNTVCKDPFRPWDPDECAFDENGPCSWPQPARWWWRSPSGLVRGLGLCSLLDSIRRVCSEFNTWVLNAVHLLTFYLICCLIKRQMHHVVLCCMFKAISPFPVSVFQYKMLYFIHYA